MAAASELLRGRRDYFLTSCDAYGLFDLHAFREFVGSRRPDAVIFTFRLPLTSRSRGGRHSHVAVSGDRVTAVHIKARGGPADPGLAGFFWVRDGRIFDGLIDGPAAAEGERIADHVFQQLVDAGRDIAAYELDEYVHLGSPEELQEHRFWSGQRFLRRQKEP
jgi:NDP-sugar pyrophosphorylase family protein